MSKAQTNNSYLAEKILLRKQSIKELKEVNVLDLFCGKMEIWSRISHNKYLGIDIKHQKNLIGDNKKYIPSLNLSIYNVIDIDTYGVPYPQIDLVLKNKTIKPGTIIFFTFIQTLFGGLNKKMLRKIGYTGSMIKKVPSLFNKDGFEKFKNYLSVENVKEINYICINNKYYGYFKA